MNLTLPRNLASLARICPKENTTRYAQSCVNVKTTDQGYRAEATDGRIMAIVQGTSSPSSHPDCNQCLKQMASEALDSGQDGVVSMLVPASFWAQIFKMKGKEPIHLHSVDDKNLVAGQNGSTITGTVGEGRFPNTDAIIPKKGPLYSVRFSPSLMIALLEVAKAISPEQGVDLHFWGPDKPLALTLRTEEGQTLDALIAPLSTK